MEKPHKGITTIRPLKDGVIADFHSAEQMIRGFIKMINRKKNTISSSFKNGYMYSFRNYRS